MRLLLFIVAVIVVLLLVWLVDEASDTGLEHDAVRVVATWGTERPSYVVDEQMFTTTTQPRARTAPTKHTTMRAASASPALIEGNINGYPCGGDLPPCFVLRRESGGNPTAQNPHSTASGLWQVLDSTWRNYAGYAKARLAPVDVQNDFARLLWNHGAGCHHWFAC